MFNHQRCLDTNIIGSRLILRNIKIGLVRCAGNNKKMIYGTLSCRSGQRLNAANRNFFASEEEAVMEGYRPCGHCMKTAFREWKAKAK